MKARYNGHPEQPSTKIERHDTTLRARQEFGTKSTYTGLASFQFLRIATYRSKEGRHQRVRTTHCFRDCLAILGTRSRNIPIQKNWVPFLDAMKTLSNNEKQEKSGGTHCTTASACVPATAPE